MELLPINTLPVGGLSPVMSKPHRNTPRDFDIWESVYLIGLGVQPQWGRDCASASPQHFQHALCGDLHRP